MTPASTRMVVDLPAPLRPTRAVEPPGGTLRSSRADRLDRTERTRRAVTSIAGVLTRLSLRLSPPTIIALASRMLTDVWRDLTRMTG